MKKNTLLTTAIAIFLILILSGCATTAKKEVALPGQLTLAEITGTDTLIGEGYPPPNSDLEKRVKVLENNTDYLKKEQDILKERVSKLEEHYSSIINNVAKDVTRKRGPDALPNIEFKEAFVSGFGSNKDELSSEMKAKVAAMAKFIKEKNIEARSKGARLEVLIEGWADGAGDVRHNQVLSLNRATMARHYLRSLLSEEEIKSVSILVQGMGVSSQKVGGNYRYVVFRLRYI